MDFCHYARNLSERYGKRLLDTATKTGLNTLKTASKKLVHKVVEAAGEFIGNNIANKIQKPKPVIEENSRTVAEIVIPPEKRQEQ